MSDPYIPPRPGTTGASGVAPNVNAGRGTYPRRDDFNRTDPNGTRPVESGGGFGTALVVAIVFVVVAALAYSLLGNRTDTVADPAVAPASEVAPDSVAPDAAAPDALAPDGVTPEAVAPDAAAPDAIAPDAVAPDAAAPDATELAPATPAPTTNP